MLTTCLLLTAAALCAQDRNISSDADVVATVHVFRHPFTDALKSRPDVERLQVTAANRDDLARVLVRKLASGF